MAYSAIVAIVRPTITGCAARTRFHAALIDSPNMANQPHRGLRRLLNAMVYSWAGLKAAWRNEEAFRQESLLSLILVPLALWLGDDGVERVLLIGSLLLIIITELLNSGIEAVVDRIGAEYHELSGRAKDISSAAVFVSLVNASLVWILLLWD